MSIKNDIINGYRNGSMLTKLLYYNLAAFVLINLIKIVCNLFQLPLDWTTTYLMMPAAFVSYISAPWTIVTYMFLHVDFVHLICNVLVLYWFGQLFLLHYSQKDLMGTYILGGLAGGAVYLFAYNLIPYYMETASHVALLGASASVMAIVVATAVADPEYRVRLVFIGNVKVEWIAFFYVLLSILGMTSSNSGGELAHIGGAVAGYLFALYYKKGTNITQWINSVISSIVNLFHKAPSFRVSHTDTSSQNQTRYESDQEYNARKKKRSDDIDRILDKIKQSGYDSLNEDERRQLFEK